MLTPHLLSLAELLKTTEDAVALEQPAGALPETGIVELHSRVDLAVAAQDHQHTHAVLETTHALQTVDLSTGAPGHTRGALAHAAMQHVMGLAVTTGVIAVLLVHVMQMPWPACLRPGAGEPSGSRMCPQSCAI